MNLPDVSAAHRSGFVAVVGQPNVGKSTLMNALLGEKLAIVSPRPQTTRDRQLGILTVPDAQIIFVDTPGIHEPRNDLGRYMVEVASGSIPDADVVVFMVDAEREPDASDRQIAESILRNNVQQVIIALNKIDNLSSRVEERQEAYHSLLPNEALLPISALTGMNLDLLLDAIVERLPLGPRYYPDDQLTETFVRDNVAEIIREQVLLLFEDEVPHAVAVKVEEFKERTEQLTYISATIYVERDSQKGIIIGNKGSMLKKVGEAARGQLEPLLETKVYLELWVKVLKNWRKDEQALRNFGYYHRK